MEGNMNKKLKVIIGGVIVLLVILVISIMYMYYNGKQAVSTVGEDVIVEINGNHAMVLNQLDEAGLLKNKTVASLYVRLNTIDFKANTYILNTNMDLHTIFTILETADFNYILQSRFTVIDGLTVPQIAQTVAEFLNIDANEVLETWSNREYLESLIEDYWFLNSVILGDDIMFPLEGYLAPQTYFVTETQPTIESITALMLDQTGVVLTEYKDQIEEFTINDETISVHEFLTFASIIQGESLFPEDHAKIAGVFMHRLEIDLRLQSDLTVNYANQVTKIAVTFEDLKVNSKYNTYMYNGLPIGPVANVSTAIIEATLDYEETDNLFFFAIQGGTVIYTKTYQEHMREISKAREEGLWLQD